MNKVFAIIALMIGLGLHAQVLKTQSCAISFFSETPVENISAVNNKSRGAINLASGAVAFTVPIRDFKFPIGLMEEHFNENYLESDKYANASFKGSVKEKIDLSKDGKLMLTAIGKLNIHGIERDRSISVEASVKDGMLIIHSRFKVKLEDHKIDRPAIVFQNIAEVIDVDINATFAP